MTQIKGKRIIFNISGKNAGKFTCVGGKPCPMWVEHWNHERDDFTAKYVDIRELMPDLYQSCNRGRYFSNNRVEIPENDGTVFLIEKRNPDYIQSIRMTRFYFSTKIDDDYQYHEFRIDGDQITAA